MTPVRTATVTAAAVAILAGTYAAALDIQIYKGTLAAPGQYLAVVGLTYRNSRTPRCTGALISQDMVLTAAHCVCDIRPSHVFLGQDPSDRSASAGSYFETGGFRAAYNCATSGSATGVDVAVVRIKGRISSTPSLALGAEAEVDPGDPLLIVGYGATDTAGQTLDYKKRFAVVPAQSPSCAKGKDVDAFGCQPDEEMVAGRLTTPDTCSGDSGGPLMVPAAGGGAPRIIAVTSRGVKGGAACGSGGIYERMQPDVVRWIGRAAASVRSTS